MRQPARAPRSVDLDVEEPALLAVHLNIGTVLSYAADPAHLRLIDTLDLEAVLFESLYYSVCRCVLFRLTCDGSPHRILGFRCRSSANSRIAASRIRARVRRDFGVSFAG